jgi:hypothetical protein
MPTPSRPDNREQQYLIDAVNRYKVKLTAADVITRFSGVRPLFDDGKGNPSAVTRDYVFELDDQQQLPLLHVFAVKSPPSVSLPNTRYKNSDRSSRKWAQTGRAAPRCLVVKFPGPTLSPICKP